MFHMSHLHIYTFTLQRYKTSLTRSRSQINSIVKGNVATAFPPIKHIITSLSFCCTTRQFKLWNRLRIFQMIFFTPCFRSFHIKDWRTRSRNAKTLTNSRTHTNAHIIYTNIHTYTHTHTYIHIHIHTHTYIHTYIHIQYHSLPVHQEKPHTHTHTPIHTYTSLFVTALCAPNGIERSVSVCTW